MNNKNRIFSIDAETDGLWGNTFAIAAIVYENGKEVDKIVLRLPSEAVTNEWTNEYVLPALIDIPVTHSSYEEMLKYFSAFYKQYKNATVLWHMGHIVEVHLFREMHRLGYIGDWDAPYTPIEVSAYLAIAGEPADSVDSYLAKNNIPIADYGSTHNPLYDCEAAYRAYEHLQINRHNK